MSKYDLYRNTICKENDNDYILLFKDEESAKIVFDEFNQKDQRIAELEKENEQLNTKLEIWNRFDKEDYIHRGENTTERDYYYYTNGASSVLENEVERLKANQNKVAIEKLEEVLKFIYGNKWTNIELCVDNSPLKIIRNKLDTMISGLKGDK